MSQATQNSVKNDQAGTGSNYAEQAETSESFDETDLALLLKNPSAAGATEPPPPNATILRQLEVADSAALNRKVLRLQRTVGNKSVQRLLTEYQIQRRLKANLNLGNLGETAQELKQNVAGSANSALTSATSKVGANLQEAVSPVTNLAEQTASLAQGRTETAEAAPKNISQSVAPPINVAAQAVPGTGEIAGKVAANVPAAAPAQAAFAQAKGVLDKMQQTKPQIVDAATKTDQKKPPAPAPLSIKAAEPTAAEVKAETVAPPKDPQLAQAAKGKPEDGVKAGDLKAPDGPVTAPKAEADPRLTEAADIAPEEIDLEKPFKVPGFAKAGQAGEIQRAVDSSLEPPKLKPPVAPEQDPDFVAVKQKTQTAAKQSQEHEPAKSKVDEANAASVAPSNEVTSQAGANQVGEMNKQKAGEFDKAAFIAAVRTAVESITPKNEDEADQFKDSGKAGQVKSQVSGMVGTNKETAEKDIDKTANATPDTGKVTPKQVVPMQPEKPGEKSATVGAENGMPKPKDATETSLEYGPNKLNKQMEDAKVTEEQLQKSNEPTFQTALTEKKKVEDDAKAKPEAFRKDEKTLLDQSKTDAKAQANTALDGMHADRTNSLGQVTGDKDNTKNEDEKIRQQLASELDKIYNDTKTEVTKILDGLDGKVNDAFDKGEKEARESFENYVKTEMDHYKDERYGGLFGWTNRVVDFFAGMPPEVNAFYTKGRDLYLSKMDTVIGGIADIVGNELTLAKTKIADGLTKSNEAIAKVAKEKPEIAREAQEGMQEKYDQLKADVDDKQNAIVDTLAQKYVESRNAVDERIKQMQEENKGVVAKAVDAVKGVIDTIIELKDMLLGVLARAAAVIDKILQDPIAFLSNLINAIKQGLGQFVSNILTHLQNGLVGWLTGALGQAGLKMPAAFDLKGILDLVLQITGLTYQNIRSRVVKATSEKFVSRLEKAAEVIMILITEGPIGLWKYIQAQAENLMNQVIEGIKDWVVTKVIQAGVNWLISTLNPAGAFIAAARAIVSVVQFIMERGSQIMSFVNSILDSVEAIANGSIGGAANAIENSLAKALPLAISFLANLLGLGGISEKIKNIIARVQRPVNNAIDKVINGVLTKFKSLFKKEDKDKNTKILKEVKDKLEKNEDEPKPFDDVKKLKVTEAEQLKAQYAKDIAEGNTMNITFGAKPQDEEHPKLDFEVTIGPEGGSQKGAIPVGGGEIIKQKVRQELSGILTNPIKEASEVKTVIDNLYAKYSPQGLKSIEVKETPAKFGEFEIMVAASAEESAKSSKVETKFRPRNLDLYKGSSRTALLAKINNQEVGKYFESGGPTKPNHAEDKFMADMTRGDDKKWKNYTIDEEGKQHKHVTIDIDITRTPCPICAGKLTGFKATMQGKYAQEIQMNINAASLYTPKDLAEDGTKEANQEESKKAIAALLDTEGIEVTSWNVDSMMQERGYDPNEAGITEEEKKNRERVINYLKERAEHLRKVLDELKAARKGSA